MPPPAAPAPSPNSYPIASPAGSSVSSTRRLLDPRNDYVFKTLFVHGPALLVDLINAVRARMPAIESIEILNPQIPPEAIEGKLIVLDLIARDETGRRFNVEMQVRRQPALSRRSVFYLARVMAGQLQAGEDYATLESVIGIHLLDFTLFDDHPDQAFWTFELRDRQWPAVALPDSPLELNLVELPKADRLGQNDRTLQKALSAWVTFFEHAKEPDIMSQIDHPPVREALSKLRKISEDELNQLRAFARERALMDQTSLVNAARGEGRAEGRADLLIRQLGVRFGALPAGTTERIRAGTADDQARWAERLLTAASLDEVFLPPVS